MNIIKFITKGGDSIVNNEKFISISAAVLLTISISTGFLNTSVFADEITGKKEENQEPFQQQATNNPFANAKITKRIISSVNHTFGYEIFVNGKTLVRQSNIPALPGNDGFKTKGEAGKVADFVMQKIRKNEMPPTITIDDLKRMGILKKDSAPKKILK